MQLGVCAVLHIADAVSDTCNDDNLSVVITLMNLTQRWILAIKTWCSRVQWNSHEDRGIGRDGQTLWR